MEHSSKIHEAQMRQSSPTFKNIPVLIWSFKGNCALLTLQGGTFAISVYTHKKSYCDIHHHKFKSRPHITEKCTGENVNTLSLLRGTVLGSCQFSLIQVITQSIWWLIEADSLQDKVRSIAHAGSDCSDGDQLPAFTLPSSPHWFIHLAGNITGKNIVDYRLLKIKGMQN